jgi:hypothetical protein
MGGEEVANMRRVWVETKFPAKGERVTPFLRMLPSWTGVTEIWEAPMSTTRAVCLPEAKLVIGLVMLGGREGWGITRRARRSLLARRRECSSFQRRFR